MRAMLELLPLYLAMPGFAFGFGFGPQGPKSTTQGTYTPPSGSAMNFSVNTNTNLITLLEDI